MDNAALCKPSLENKLSRVEVLGVGSVPLLMLPRVRCVLPCNRAVAGIQAEGGAWNMPAHDPFVNHVKTCNSRRVKRAPVSNTMARAM